MLAVDLKKGKFSLNDELKTEVAQRRPYGQWSEQTTIALPHKTFDHGD